MPITKNIVSRTIGASSGASQTFIQNYCIENEIDQVEPFIFKLPRFSIQGATYNYYNQVIDGISVNLNNAKDLDYTYSANTDSFSAITRVIYDVYRVNYDIYDAAVSNIDNEGDEIENITGATPTINTVSSLLSTPFVTLYESGSTISTPAHNYEFPATVKPTGLFAEQLLNDKAQYFVDTRFEFVRPRDKSLGEYQTISGGSIVDYSLTGLTDDKESFLLETEIDEHIISGGTFSGISVNGAFFTYFVAPQRPEIDVVDGAPTAAGNLDTFSPIFSFNNVDDGDYYKLQVSYDVSDSSYSAGTTFVIPRQEGVPDFIRTFSVPLTPDSAFIYRIGNTKEIKNVFGVKQNVTTWGRSEEAFTATDGAFDVSGVIYQDESYGSPVSATTVVFTVSFTTSTVELGADATIDEDIDSGTSEPLGGGTGTIFSAVTASDGSYGIPNVKGGILSVTLINPLYETTTDSIVLDTNRADADFNIILRWGSSTTFQQVYGQRFV